MEHTIREPLHLDSESFRDLLQASSEDLKIPVQLIEKDYYISAILRSLSKSTYSRQIVFNPSFTAKMNFGAFCPET